MRESRAVQSSIFDSYSQNEHGQMLCSLSDLLDKHPQMLSVLKTGFNQFGGPKNRSVWSERGKYISLPAAQEHPANQLQEIGVLSV